LFLASDWDSKGVLLSGSAQCPKNHYDMPINTTPSEKKKRGFERTYELINMNHSTLHETEMFTLFNIVGLGEESRFKQMLGGF
jgi:hypothetical protein